MPDSKVFPNRAIDLVLKTLLDWVTGQCIAMVRKNSRLCHYPTFGSVNGRIWQNIRQSNHQGVAIHFRGRVSIMGRLFIGSPSIAGANGNSCKLVTISSEGTDVFCCVCIMNGFIAEFLISKNERGIPVLVVAMCIKPKASYQGI